MATNTNNKLSKNIFGCLVSENGNAEGLKLESFASIFYKNEKHHTTERNNIHIPKKMISEGVTDESPVGRLKMAKEKWKSAGANAYIMRVISEGYTVPFRDLPPSKVMKNNKSASDNI